MVILESLACMGVAWLTYIAIKKTDLSPTRVSSQITLLCALLLYLFNLWYALDLLRLGSIILGASFVGMSSHKIISSQETLIAGFLFYLLFVNFSQTLAGIGGALGFSAFLALLFSRSLAKLHYLLISKS